VREIGMRLYNLDENKKDLVVKMHAQLYPIRGADGNLLERAWHGIGNWYA
jgi:hypothetical protein